MTTVGTKTTQESLPSRLSELRSLIDEALPRYCAAEEGCPDHLHEAMQYALLSPGKRFRPLLTLLAADACDGDIESAMPAACAVEMIHAYSLVHDDLPAMDDDDLRRGRPTCHKRFGEAVAILAGDALLTMAFEVLTRHVRPLEVAGECCALLATAAGARNLVGGQADDILPDPTQRSIEKLESVHRRKTGALILVSLQLGAAVSAAGEPAKRALEDYGMRLGLAFQITDDLLDVLGDAGQEGKRLQKDAALGKLTFPEVLGVSESVDRVTRLIQSACQISDSLGPRARDLEAIARNLLRRLPIGNLYSS